MYSNSFVKFKNNFMEHIEKFPAPCTIQKFLAQSRVKNINFQYVVKILSGVGVKIQGIN